MRFLTTRAPAPAASLKTAIVEGLAPDGGLYMPESIERWHGGELAQLPSRSLIDLAVRVLDPFTRDDLSDGTLTAAVGEALTFPIPLVEIEPGVHALELFHGPTLAFKDIGARVMARLMAALGIDATVLVATSGDTGSAVAHAFHGVAHTRVVILYPDRRVSPTQEAQLTMFNGDEGSNVCAYAIDGSFDDCQRLAKAAFADAALRRRVRLTSANSINIGRLLPQMIYYFHAVAELGRAGPAPTSLGRASPAPAATTSRPAVISTPSGNFGNLTAGLMAKRAGLPVARFIAATNVNDVVPHYLATGRFEPRASMPTLANAMDVGNPSNFDRMFWMYGGDVDAMRRDLAGSRHDDDEVRATIGRVYDERGYLLDPHSAIGYLGLKRWRGREGREGQAGIFLATAHPAKFAEIVEPIVGRAIDTPAPLADALARSRQIVRMPATLDALRDELVAGGW
jgi:threonine synthase